MANNITTVVEYKVTQAIKALQDTQKELGKTEISGADLADALSRGASDAAQELAKIKVAAAAMSQSLDADFVEARAAAGVSVEDMVMELNRLGASFDEIAAHSDKLASSVQQLNKVQNPIREIGPAANTAADGLDRVTHSGDQSRSVMANLVGNSVQDLAQLGGVAGTAGVALGQLGEYAADGNIKLSNLVNLVGPMAGLGIATVAVGKAVETAAENARIAKEQTQLWLDLQKQFDTAALEPPDLGPTAESFVEQYQGTINALEELGYSIADFVAITRGDGAAVLDELNARQVELADKVANSADGLAVLTDAELAEYNSLTSLTSNLAGFNAAQENAVTQYDTRKRQSAEMQAALEAELAATLAIAGGNRSTAGDIENAYERMGAAAQETIAETQSRLSDWLADVEGIPEERRTEIQADIDRGAIGAAEAALNNVARDRTATVKVQLAFGKPNERGKGSAVGKGDKGVAGYDPQSILNDMFSDAGSGGGGSGGGGGGAASPAETEAEKWDDAIAKAYEYGEITTQQYIDYLTQRLTGEDRYSDKYFQLWKERQGLEQMLDDQAEKRRKDQEAAEREAADAAEKARKEAEETTKALEKQQQALGNLIINITNTNADPQAVVRAVEQARRMFGNRWLTG